MISNTRVYAWVSFAAAAAWPFVVGGSTALTMSPLDRALRDAWCGAPVHGPAEFLGHCAACWAGSALFAALGSLLLTADRAELRTAPFHRALR